MPAAIIFNKKIESYINEMRKNKIAQIGFLGNVYYPNGVNLVEVAMRNEFGVPENNQPPRPFMRETFKAKHSNWSQQLGKNLSKKFDVTIGLVKISELAVKDIKQSVIDFKYPPNSPYTILKKGKDDPLVDTEFMLDHVDYEVIDHEFT